MPGYCENVGELVGVPWLRVVWPSSDKFATLLPHAGGTSQVRDGGAVVVK